MKKNLKNKFSFFNSRPTLLILLFVLALIVGFLVKNLARDYQVENEIKELEEQIGDLEKENMQLNDLSRYFSSDFFIEEQARTKLGLKKEGEGSVIIKDFEVLNGSSGNVNKSADDLAYKIAEFERVPNYKKWWAYFFTN